VKIAKLPYIKKSYLEKKWKHGFCKIKGLKNINDISGYLTKQINKISIYVTKNIKDIQFKGLRRFYCSNSVIKPEKFYNKEADKLVNFCLNRKYKLVDEKEFKVDFIGYIKYKSFLIKKGISLGDIDWAVYGYDNKPTSQYYEK